MAANKDAIQRDEHPLAAEPHPIRPTRPLRAPAPPKPSSAFMKLLTFKKAEGPIADFPSEQKVSARTIWLFVAALVGVGLAIALAVLAPRWWAGAPAPQVGQLAIISQPTGAEVIVDQQPRGVTPLTLSLPSGAHTVLLNRGDVSRSFEVNIKAGAEVLHHVDLEPRQLVAQGGQLPRLELVGGQLDERPEAALHAQRELLGRLDRRQRRLQARLDVERLTHACFTLHRPRPS